MINRAELAGERLFVTATGTYKPLVTIKPSTARLPGATHLAAVMQKEPVCSCAPCIWRWLYVHGRTHSTTDMTQLCRVYALGYAC